MLIAKKHLEKALRIYQKIQLPENSVLLCRLGILFFNEKDYSQAEFYYRKSLAIALADNAHIMIHANLHNLAEMSLARGSHEASLDFCLEAFEVAVQSDYKKAQIETLELLATALSAQHYFSHAVYFLAVTERLRQEYNRPGSVADEQRVTISIKNLREALSKEQFQLEWNKGQYFDFQDIVRQVFNQVWHT